MKRLALILFLAAPALPAAAAGNTPASQRGPAGFVESLYRRYETDGASVASPTGPEATRIFDPVLLHLIRRDQANAAGETGILDYDPICDCQDSAGLTDLHVKARMRGTSAADATARFTISADRVVVRYRLVRTTFGWLVADIATAKAPSLKTLLSHAAETSGGR